MATHWVPAPVLDLLPLPEEPSGLQARRATLLEGARGRVLEVGGSSGRNAAHWPAGRVELVVSLSPKAARRRRLMERVAAAAVPVEVHEAVLEEAPFADGSFDTVVSTLALCSVPDLAAATAAMRRLVADDGSLLLLEHGRPGGVGSLVQALVSPVRHAVSACRPDRDVLAAVRAAGFAVTDCDRFTVPGGPLGGAVLAAVAIPKRPAAATA